jgi:hypothetical protein
MVKLFQQPVVGEYAVYRDGLRWSIMARCIGRSAIDRIAVYDEPTEPEALSGYMMLEAILRQPGLMRA